MDGCGSTSKRHPSMDDRDGRRPDILRCGARISSHHQHNLRSAARVTSVVVAFNIFFQITGRSLVLACCPFPFSIHSYIQFRHHIVPLQSFIRFLDQKVGFFCFLGETNKPLGYLEQIYYHISCLIFFISNYTL
jgi:L-asparaginase II